MDIISLIIQLVAGAIGGNAAGAAMKDKSLGTLGNSIAGVVGGIGAGQILDRLLAGAPAAGCRAPSASPGWAAVPPMGEGVPAFSDSSMMSSAALARSRRPSAGSASNPSSRTSSLAQAASSFGSGFPAASNLCRTNFSIPWTTEGCRTAYSRGTRRAETEPSEDAGE